MTTRGYPWQALKVLCNGISILDIPRLELKSESEAHQFLATYGFDLFLPEHVEQMWKIYADACSFIERLLCDADHPFPKELKRRENLGDFKNLLLVASGIEIEGYRFSEKRYQLWICAILRVMHTITHLQSDLRLKYIKKIKRQTVDRFSAHIQRQSENGLEQIFLGFERDKVRLADFQKKESKVRESMLLKLLHKSETVAQEIYDHVGVRFVTFTRAEAFNVIRYLIEHHLISYANAMASRCRNSLINLDDLRQCLAENGLEDIDANTDSRWAEWDKDFEFPRESENRFSASDYHAIQFTCRPLIRIPMLKKGVRSEMSFFFPFEIQIMDLASYKQSIEGAADHQIYKKKQLEAVRLRVLRGLV